MDDNDIILDPTWMLRAGASPVCACTMTRIIQTFGNEPGDAATAARRGTRITLPTAAASCDSEN